MIESRLHITPPEITYREDLIIILKRLQRRMRMKSVRLLQLVNKLKEKRNNDKVSRGIGHGAALIMRAHTWEAACALLDEEIGALEKWTKKTKRSN